MNERDKRRVGEQIEPGGRPKAPGRLELLQRFINTHNHDFPPEWDRIGTPEKAQAWLRQKRLVAPGDRISDADIAEVNLPTGVPLRYELDDEFRPVDAGKAPLDRALGDAEAVAAAASAVAAQTGGR